jgi:hypothetical protein
MTLCFMAIMAVIIAKRIDARLGAALLWPLIATGVLTCFWGTIPATCDSTVDIRAQIQRYGLLDRCRHRVSMQPGSW